MAQRSPILLIICTTICCTLQQALGQKTQSESNEQGNLERTIETSPNDVQSRFRLANILATQGSTYAARQELERCVQLRPDFNAAWYNLAQLLVATGSLVEAQHCFGEYLKLVPAGSTADRAKSMIAACARMEKRAVQSSSKKDYFDELAPKERAHWPIDHLKLTVYVEPSQKYFKDSQAYTDAVDSAFKKWSDALASSITFTCIDQPFKADILVGWSPDPGGDVSSCEAGHCKIFYKKGNPGVINRAFIFLHPTDNNGTPYTPGAVQSIAEHEIGHGLGIGGHSSNSQDAMYFFSMPSLKRCSVGRRDGDTVLRLHNCKQSD